LGVRMIDESLGSKLLELIPDGGFTLATLQEEPAYAEMLAVIQSQPMADADQCAHIVKSLTRLTKDRDVPTQIALRLLAESVVWPMYERGDGYWAEPSRNAVALVRMGRDLSASDVWLARDVLTLPYRGVGFIGLGLAVNEDMPREVILSLVGLEDPVLAAASAHSSLGVEDVRTILSRMENGVWVGLWILGGDGWTWPDWQDAFGVVSEDASQPLAFWEAVLTDLLNPSQHLWTELFLDSIEDADFDVEELESLLALMSAYPHLESLALQSAWPGAVTAVAMTSADPATLQQLAVSEIPEVREAVMANEHSTNEIRALAALNR